MYRKAYNLATVVLLALLTGGSAAFSQPAESLATPGEYLAGVLPVVGSTPGNFGSYFKTAVQVHNPGPFTLSFRLVYHPMGQSGGPGDPSLSLSLGPRLTVYYEDMLPALGVATGLGSLDVFVPVGSVPAAATTVRVFNDAGAAGTSGFTEEFIALDDAITAGQEAYLLSPPNFTGFRFNVGVRSLEQGATLRVTVRNAGGVVTRTVTRTYAPNYFEQTSVDAFLGAGLAGNESLTIEVTAGAALLYGATTDNRTNDSSYQLAQRLID
jgi:hypothetical protein